MKAATLIMPPSLWSATAIQGHEVLPLMEDKHVDVAVVGAGYTGLVTALHLAVGGARVCVLDAGEPGWGASGRNGGQVIPGLKYDPDELQKMFGGEQAETLIRVAEKAADEVFDLVKRYNIDCDAMQNGWIQPAASPAALRAIERRAKQWQHRGVPIELLDRARTTQRIGSPDYLGAWVDPRAGSLQPLSYVRGIARAAITEGAEVFSDSRVAKLERDTAGWCLTTTRGNRVKAERVVLATNGYTDNLWPGLRQTVLAANSFIVATEPLSKSLADTVLPGGEVCSDARRLLLYFKKDAQGRVLVGGRGPFAEPSSQGDWSHLERSLSGIFPQLAGVPFEYRWSGRVALTQDFLPHVHEPEPGLSIVLGYNGRGIAMSTTLGRHLALRILGETRGFPFPVTHIRRIPFHNLQRFYLGAGIAWYRLLDAFF